jgi:hypothetical protein
VTTESNSATIHCLIAFLQHLQLHFPAYSSISKALTRLLMEYAYGLSSPLTSAPSHPSTIPRTFLSPPWDFAPYHLLAYSSATYLTP